MIEEIKSIITRLKEIEKPYQTVAYTIGHYEINTALAVLRTAVGKLVTVSL
jgi:hypothetical protein